jgi:hypothetical protein
MKFIKYVVFFFSTFLSSVSGMALDNSGDVEFYKIVRVSVGITLDEWNNLIESDPSLEQVPDRHGINPFTSEKVVFSGVGKAYFLFMGEKTGNIILNDGMLYTTGVPRSKCDEVANKLRAIVIKDDRS